MEDEYARSHAFGKKEVTKLPMTDRATHTAVISSGSYLLKRNYGREIEWSEIANLHCPINNGKSALPKLVIPYDNNRVQQVSTKINTSASKTGHEELRLGRTMDRTGLKPRGSDGWAELGIARAKKIDRARMRSAWSQAKVGT
jgi:hypothetical protein